MGNSNLHEEKKRIRQVLKAHRQRLSESERNYKSEKIRQNLYALAEFKSAKTVFCFISCLNEVDTHPIISDMMTRGVRVAAPRIVDKTRMIAVGIDDWDALKPDEYGILTPESTAPVTAPVDIALTPGLGFTREGERIGHGRGYYDRWFSVNPVRARIGLAFSEQIAAELPLEKNDIPLHIIITDEATIHVDAV